MQLFVSIENYWATNAPEEGRAWASSLLDGRPAIPDRLRARALRVHGGMWGLTGHPHVADRLWQESLDIFRRLGDEQGIGLMLHRLSTTAAMRGEWPRARELAEESLEKFRRIGFGKGETQAVAMLGNVARVEGDLERSLELLDESARIAESTGFRWWLAGTLATSARVSFDLGRTADALRRATQALALSRAMGDRPGILTELSLVAEIFAVTGDTHRAGLLWGAVEAEMERTPPRSWLFGPVVPERVLAHADGEFESAREEGRELTLDDAVTQALAAPDAVETSTSGTAHP